MVNLEKAVFNFFFRIWIPGFLCKNKLIGDIWKMWRVALSLPPYENDMHFDTSISDIVPSIKFIITNLYEFIQ